MDTISQNLIFYIPKSRNTPANYKNYPGLVPVSVSSEAITSARKKTAKGFCASMTGEPVDQIEEVVIPNDGFKFSLIEKLEDESCYNTVGYCPSGNIGTSSPVIGIYISNPSLDKVMGAGKRAHLMISVRNFFEILRENVGYISNREIHGTFCLDPEPTYQSSYSCPRFIFEDPTDQDLETAKSRGKLILTGKGTSNWIPGHKYYIKSNGTTVIALGTVDNVLVGSNWVTNSKFDFGVTSNLFKKSYEFRRVRFLKSAKVYLRLDRDTTLNMVDEWQGKSVTSFLMEVIDNMSKTSYSYDYPLVFREIAPGSNITGIDQGEFMTFDDSQGTLSDQVKLKVAQKLCGRKITSTTNTMLVSLWPEGIKNNTEWMDSLDDMFEWAVKQDIANLKSAGLVNITAKSLIGTQTIPGSTYWNRTVECEAYRWFQGNIFYDLSQQELEDKLNKFIADNNG